MLMGLRVRFFWLFFIAPLFVALSSRAFSAETFPLSRAEEFGAHLSVFEDSTSRLSIDDIVAKDRLGAFTPRERLGKNGYGFTRSSIWVRTVLVNDTAKEEWFLGSTRPDFTVMDVYIFAKDGRALTARSIGTLAKDRLLDTRMPTDRFFFAKGETYTIYIKVQSPLQLSLTFFLSDVKSYFNFVLRESRLYFAYFGTVIALILYNFCLFLCLRHRDYLFYSFFGLSMVANAYVQGGFLEQGLFQWPFLSSVNDSHRLILLPSIASILYTRSFLRLSEFAPRLDRIMVGLACLAMLVFILLNVEDSFALKSLVSGFDALAVLFVFVASALAIRNGDKTAKVFLLAWGILATSVVLWVMGNAGLIEKSTWIAFAPLIGNVIEMILMSIALALRIKELEAAKIKAEMKAREKDNLQHLLRMVCHDITNPLTIIKSLFFVQERRKRQAGESVEQDWLRIKRASDSIEAIINQVRKYEAFRSGKVDFDLKPCSVRQLFQDVDFYFQTRALEKGLTLDFEIRGAEDFLIIADQTSLSHEIFNNLVSNAIKFSEPGGSVKLTAETKDNVWVLVTIEDEGIGIPKEMLSTLFEPTARHSRNGTRGETGTGFGMPIVKTFVDLFGATISIESCESEGKQESRGTRIVLKFRLAPPSER